MHFCMHLIFEECAFKINLLLQAIIKRQSSRLAVITCLFLMSLCLFLCFTATFLKTEDIVQALENGIIERGLVDSLGAADMQSRLAKSNIEVTRFFRDPHGFGIVLSSDMLKMKDKFQKHVKENQIKIMQKIKSYKNVLKVRLYCILNTKHRANSTITYTHL